jgi:hypothetical protein
MARRYSIEDMEEIAALHGGECLSDEYGSTKSVLRWKCANDHVWESLADTVIRGGWCPRCAKMRYSIDDMRALARKHGGACLSAIYRGTLVKLEWRCAQGHEWLSTPNTILSGCWCPSCRRGVRDIDEMRTLARQRGGACLSDEYINQNTKLRWRCGAGHEWDATPHHVLHARSWCPYCAGRIVTLEDMRAIARERGGECLSRRYVKSNGVMRFRCASGHEFRTRAVNVRMGHWCRECGGTKPLTLAKMRAAAAARGGQCLSKRYVNTQTKLRWRCAEGHEWMAVPSHVIGNRSWCPECSPSRMATIEEMRAIAKERGGRCLSKTYVKSRARLLWECAEGHRFEATPMGIWDGRWCLVCKHAGRGQHRPSRGARRQ